MKTSAMRLLVSLLVALFLPLAALAECVGQNLIDALPADQTAAIRAAADAVPFAHGNFWTAERDGQKITLAGTLHIDDPRHEAATQWLIPEILGTSALLVEAGPEEEKALLAYIAAHPERMIIQTGPTLPEALPEAQWQRLSGALRARGIPPFMAAKLQPWYVASILAIPACQLSLGAAMNGLDRRLTDAATAGGIQVQALEPFDTIFGIFDSFTQADQMAMLVQTLADVDGNDDMAVTLSDSYFAGENRLFWEFSKLHLLNVPGLSPQELQREFDLMETALITRRNATWIAPIEAAAAKGPVVVAFGALHLPGDKGVLNLLAQNGWTISPLPQ